MGKGLMSVAHAESVVGGSRGVKEARLYRARDIRVGDAERPVPGPEESLVRVSAVGLCGSDLHWFDEGGIGDSSLGRPLVLGHEFAGFVEGGVLDGRLV